MPGAADLIFLALFASLVFTPLSVRLLGDAGIGWHIRTGQQILATHSIPRVDPFSSTMAGKPWYAWEWLYDAMVGRLAETLGLNGVVWLTAIVIAAVFAATFRLLLRRGMNLFLAVFLMLLALSASTIHFLARPHVVSWLFALLCWAILDSSESAAFSPPGSANDLTRRTLSPSAKLWTLPLFVIAWVNLHGGFLIAFVLLAIFWMSALWTWLRADSSRIEAALEKIAARRRVIDLTLVGLLSAVASLINPYGWRLYAHIYGYLSNRFLMDHIDEFRSPDFHGVAQRCFLVLLLIALAALALRERRLRLSGLLTVLFAAYSGLYATRNLPVSSVLLVMVIGPLLVCDRDGIGLFGRELSGFSAIRSRLLQFSERMSAMECSLRGHLWPAIAIVATFFLAANGGRLGSQALMDAHFSPERMPVAAVDFLAHASTPGPILSVDYWGGYLIYRLSPNTQVVLDDRHDLYGAAFLKSYLKAIHAEPGWEGFLREHSPGCVLLPKDAALAAVLPLTGRWKPVYSDDVAVVFLPAK
jgi:hypothetical protein